jgi:PRTRC genetic system ParB family protein
MTTEILNINVGYIIKSDINPRRVVKNKSIYELEESIREHGILQPIIVRPFKGNPKKFEIVCGERRYVAACSLGLDNVPCIVRKVDDQEALEIAIIENLQRQDVNAINEAEAFKRLLMQYETKGMGIAEIASKTGKTESYISGRLKLLDLPDKVKLAIAEETISPGHGLVMVRVQDPEAQLRMLDTIVREKLSIRAAENMLKYQGKEISGAPFNTADCETCPHNGTTQKDLFDSDTSISGRCLNTKCFDGKCEEEFARKIKELKKKGNKVELESELKSRINNYSRHETAEICNEIKLRLGDNYKNKCLKCKNHVFAIEPLQYWNEDSSKVITERCLKLSCCSKLTTPPPDPEQERIKEEESKAREDALKEQKEDVRLRSEVCKNIDSHIALCIILNVLCEDTTASEIVSEKFKPEGAINLKYFLQLEQEVLYEIMIEVSKDYITDTWSRIDIEDLKAINLALEGRQKKG